MLASRSAGRAALLQAAAVPFDAMAAPVDEDAAKASLRAERLAPRDLADALADLKAQAVARRHPDRLVLGADQILALDDGTTLDKPTSRAEAADQLRLLRGRTHRLLSAAVLIAEGRAIWRHVEEARLSVRAFSDAFLEDYLDAEWPAIAGCVGGYRVEGRGVTLFERIEGTQAAIVGLPLLPLLAQLRRLGVMPS
nr:nucleoside triphosphate pyrophosphatase [Sphingomonas jejuensis]